MTSFHVPYPTLKGGRLSPPSPGLPQKGLPQWGLPNGNPGGPCQYNWCLQFEYPASRPTPIPNVTGHAAPSYLRKIKILEETTIMWKHPNKYTHCGKSSDKLVWTKTTLSMDFKPFILIRYFSLVYREYSSVQEVTLPSNPIFLLFTGNIPVSKR